MGTTRGWASTSTAALVIAGVAYSSWVVDFIVPTGRDRLRSFLSELEEPGVPLHQLYSAGDVVAGVAVVVAAAILSTVGPPGRAARCASAAAGVFGAATVADALSPMDAVPVIHAATSATAVFSLFVTMGAATWAAFRDGVWSPLRTSGATAFALVTIATGWMLGSDRLQCDYLLGLAQRVQVGAMSMWLIVWGLSLSVGTWWCTRSSPACRQALRRP